MIQSDLSPEVAAAPAASPGSLPQATAWKSRGFEWRIRFLADPVEFPDAWLEENRIR